MAIVLSHWAAFRCLRAWEALEKNRKGLLVPDLPSARHLDAGTLERPTKAQATSLLALRDPTVDTTGEALLGAPVDVLVRTDASRRGTDLVRPHRWPLDLAPEHVRFVQPGLYVSAPELCPVQLASQLSDAFLALLGCSLTATYALSASSPYGVAETAPLTSLSRMSGALDLLGSVRGAARVRRLLPCVLEGAASPVEARLGLYLSLPRLLGGHGLPKPVLNQRFDVNGDVSKVADRSHYRGDLCWPDAGIALEYDSDAAHTGSERIAADTRRRNALAAMGVTVLGVTRLQVRSQEELDKVAHIVGLRLGVSMRERSRTRAARRRRLYEELFETTGQPL